VEYHDGTFERYRYNGDGLIVEAENDNSLVKITRGKAGCVTQEWQDGHTVESKYGKFGQRTSLTSSLGAKLDMGYTDAGLLKEMKAEHWEMALQYDSRGLEIERQLTGCVTSRSEYDEIGRIKNHSVMTARGKHTRKVRYRWGVNDRLVSITDELTRKEACGKSIARCPRAPSRSCPLKIFYY
jgi:uncharacterized protein RhaS with RHS repeats